MNEDRIVRPSQWYYALGVAVILAGLSLFAYALFHGIDHVTDGLTQIVVPGEKDLTLMPRLKYTIFLETESVVDGRIYSTTESISGLTCEVTSETSGDEIETRLPTMDTTYSLSGRSGRSVFEFVTGEGGDYRVACGYGEGSQGPQTVVAVGSGMGENIFSTVMKSTLSFFGGCILGGAIILRVLILRDRAKKKLGATS